MTTRLLASDDEAALEAFLVQHRDTSMFLRGNVRLAGLDFAGQWAGAQYLASFDRDAITGVAAHCWNGIVLMQAPANARALAAVCVETSGRAARGRGATLAILFTSNPSARRTYEAIRFRRIGDYALVLFDPGRP